MMQTSTVSTGFKSSVLLISILQIVAFAVLTALCAARIPLPFSPVPITLQSLSVVLAGAMLGPWRGALSQITLIGMGLIGLPVFSDRLPGFITLAGPTGGYILGFVLCAFVTGWIVRYQKPAGFWTKSLYFFVASLFIFLPGVLWLKVLTGASLATALAMGFYPFLLGDVIKTFVAAGFLKAVRK